MPTALCRTVPVKTSGPSWFRRAAVLLLVLFFLLILPAAALAAAAVASPAGGPAAATAEMPEIQEAEPGGTTSTALSAAVVTTRPTLVPSRPGNTTLLQAIKNIISRPQVLIPTGLFLIILAIAILGLLTFLNRLLRKRAGSHATPADVKNVAAGNVTLVDEQPAPAPAREEAVGPAVPFPLSLGKRFLHPVFIGEGGLARVFRAQDAKTGMTVAVKVPVRFDEVTGTHFTKDIALWQGLVHPNIIRIRSSNILPVPYIEMEYAPSSLSGIPLPLPEEKAVSMVLGIGRGLAYAHEQGVVHRDIKPENILISSYGVPKITDWGLGKAIGDPRQSSMIGFSPAYAAPEQLAPHRFGRPGPATDIYQLGMLLFELLTGAPAFRREGIHDLNLAILEEAPVIPRWGGRHEHELRGIILRCLAKKPEERYASVADLVRDLEVVL